MAAGSIPVGPVLIFNHLFLGGGINTTNDILKHELIPEHIIVADDDKDLLKNLKCDEKKLPEKIKRQLPKIIGPNNERTDPVVEAIGAVDGDIIQITRKSETAGTFVCYRIVRS